MASDLLSYLMEEKMAELEEQQAAELARREAALRQSLQQTLEEMIISRFPQAPITLGRDIRRMTDPATLQQLMVALVRAADLTEFEQALAQAVAAR